MVEGSQLPLGHIFSLRVSDGFAARGFVVSQKNPETRKVYLASNCSVGYVRMAWGMAVFGGRERVPRVRGWSRVNMARVYDGEVKMARVRMACENGTRVRWRG